MLIITGMLGRGTLYITSSAIVDVVETIGCFGFLDAEGDGPVRLTNVKFRAVGDWTFQPPTFQTSIQNIPLYS